MKDLFIRMKKNEDFKSIENLMIDELKEVSIQAMTILSTVNGIGYVRKDGFNCFYDSEILVSIDSNFKKCKDTAKYLVEYSKDELSNIIVLLTGEMFLKQQNEENKKHFVDTCIVRRIDDLGRIVIPKEIRHRLRIQEGDPLKISLYGAKVCFEPYYPDRELSKEIQMLSEQVKENELISSSKKDAIFSLFKQIQDVLKE